MKNKIYIILIAVFPLLCLNSCKKAYAPKPYGYVRIAIPDTAYHTFDSIGYPYTFHVSDNASVTPKIENNEHYWLDILYPQFKATIHCSYKPIQNNLYELSQESQKFVYKHAQMASAIPEQGYENPDLNVYGVLYEIQGNTASPYQFVLTDSTNHFFRGALYFNSAPNQDSLAPVIDYMRLDIIELIESFSWKK